MWGLEEPGELDRLLVISPHLDDAILSCGALLLAHPGATVATLFAASPAEYTNPLNEHDTECGYQPGDDTMAARRDEDVCAMAAVGATSRWLPLCQNSHVERADPLAVPPGAVDAIVESIAEVRPTCVVALLGLSHVDHQACHFSALEARDAWRPTFRGSGTATCRTCSSRGCSRHGFACCTSWASPRRRRARRCHTTSRRSGGCSVNMRRR